MSERLHTYHVLSAEEVRTMAEALSKSDASRIFLRFFDDMCASHETLRAQLAAREAERDALLCGRHHNEMEQALAEIATLKEQLTEATRALGVIGDRAVVDFDSATVGEVAAALAKIPQTYRDAYVTWAIGAIDAHKRAERAEETLRVCRAALKGCYDVTDWPANGQTVQDDAIAVADAALAPASAQEGKIVK